MVTDQASDIVGSLAVALAQIENALETEADAAARHGVQIMPGGQPGPEPFGPPASAAQATQQQWAASYQQVWQQAGSKPRPSQPGPAAGRRPAHAAVPADRPAQERATAASAPGDYATLSDLLADVGAVPTASRRDVHELIEKLQGRKAARTQRSPLQGAAGKPLPEDALDETSGVHSELAEARQELPAAGRGENALTKLLDSRVGNVHDYLAGARGPRRARSRPHPRGPRRWRGTIPGWWAS